MSPDKTEALLSIATQFADDDNLCIMDIVVEGQFTINVDSDLENYLSINGTAILFPYVRSIISMITSLDNENAVILSAFNTYSFARNKEELDEN